MWGKATFGNDSKKKPQDTNKNLKKKLLRKASSDETQLLSCRSVILSAARRPAAVRLLEKALQRSELSDLSANAKIKLNLLLKYNHWLTVGFPFFDSLNKNVFFCTSGLKPVTSFFFKSSVEQQSLCFGAQMLTWNSSCEMNLMNRRTSESLRTTTATKKKRSRSGKNNIDKMAEELHTDLWLLIWQILAVQTRDTDRQN